MNEGKTRIFVDRNVVLYLLSGEPARADRAECLLRETPTVSVQVLNEVTNICIRKLGMTWDDVAQFLGVVRSLCTVVSLTVEVHDLARQLAQRHGLAFYDSCIVAAASLAGCDILYTEDLHHGLIIEESTTHQLQTERQGCHAAGQGITPDQQRSRNSRRVSYASSVKGPF